MTVTVLKTNTFKFQFDLECTDTFQRVLMNSLVIRGYTNYNLQYNLQNSLVIYKEKTKELSV